MKLEDILCDLKYARQLKKLKVKQDSLYFYGKMIGVDHVYPSGYKIYDSEKASKFKNDYSAFTTDELLKLIPFSVECKCLVIEKFEESYKVSYNYWHGNDLCDDYDQHNKKLCNALAQMLIYLIKEKFIEVK